MWEVVDLQAIGQVANAGATGVIITLRRTVGVRDDDYTVATINKFLECVVSLLDR